jgi:cyclophilin family peptidyl-prolyl cis-trans isomerase
MRSGSATEVPPNFWTRSATGGNGTSGAEVALNPDRSESQCGGADWVRSGAVGTNAEKHARQKERRGRVDEARRQVEQQARRRRTMTIVGGVIAVLVVIGVVVAFTRGDDTEETASDDTPTTTASEATSTSMAPAVELPAPPPGITLTEDTECPPAEGAEERVQKFAGPPPECIDPDATYTATFSTTEGDFTATLDAQAAPETVNNFVVLARYRYYDGVPFHRIVPGFVIQAGDGDGDPWGNNDLGYSIADELPADSSAYSDYALAMANSGPDTNGSQFFVVLPGGGAQLQPLYSFFGQVTEGTEVVDAIGTYANGQDPTKAILIDSITITETPAG